MKKEKFTTISIKPIISQELGRLRKVYKTSKAGVIRILILRNREFTKMKSKENYISLIQTENINQQEFLEKVDAVIQNQRTLNKNVKELKMLFPTRIPQIRKKRNI